MFAVVTVAGSTACRALTAHRRTAVFAGVQTVVAEVFIAAAATDDFFGIANHAALTARQSAPVFERHVGRRIVVGLQHGAREQEHIGKAARLQRIGHRQGRISRTKPFVADMRMGDVRVVRRRVGVECGDSQTAIDRAVERALDLEADREATEFDAVQVNRFRGGD